MYKLMNIESKICSRAEQLMIPLVMAKKYNMLINTHLKQTQPLPAGGAVHAKVTEVLSLLLV